MTNLKPIHRSFLYGTKLAVQNRAVLERKPGPIYTEGLKILT